MLIDQKRYEAYDVVVAGGGLSGITAAIAAARHGANTVLIERSGWLGGIGITGATGLHSYFNIFQAHDGVERMRVIGGLAQELVDRTAALGGTPGHVLMERGGDFVSMLTPVEPEAFKLAAALICREAGVRLLLHTVMDEVQASDGHVTGIVVWNKRGRSLIRGTQFVDATGDGDLAAAAGALHDHFTADSDGSYNTGFTFRLCNVKLDALEKDLEARGLIRQLAHAVRPGRSAPELVRLGIHMQGLRDAGIEDAPRYFLSSSLRPNELTYCNCINVGPNDGLDVDALTDAEVSLRGKMFDVAAAFRKHFAGCEDCYPAGPAPYAGPRRGRAIRCAYDITQEDCTEGRRFDDEIGVYSFIDNGRYFVKDGGAYGIPYRSLVPIGADNVPVAGRMMTVDKVGHNSTRNTGCCMITGQAAGTAAALAGQKSVSPAEVDVEQLREMLAADRVILDPVVDPLQHIDPRKQFLIQNDQ